MDAIKNEYFSEEMISSIRNCLFFLKPKTIGFFIEHGKTDEVMIPDGMGVNDVKIVYHDDYEIDFKILFGSGDHMFIVLTDIKDMLVHINDKDIDFTTKNNGNFHITLSKSIDTL